MSENQSSKDLDLIWEALTEYFGKVRTPSERGRRNRAVRELRLAQATPEEIAVAVDFCRRNFTSFTEMAVCSWLSRALRENEEKGQSRDLFMKMVEKSQEGKKNGED